MARRNERPGNRTVSEFVTTKAPEPNGGLQDVGQFGVAAGHRGLSRTSPIPAEAKQNLNLYTF